MSFRMLLEHAGWQNRVIQGTGAGWLCEQSNPFSKAVKLESQFSPFGRKWRFEDGGLPCFKERERHQRQHQQARRRVSGPAPLRRDRGSRDPVFHASHPDCRVHASYPLKAKQYSGHTSARIRKLRHRDVNYLWKAPQLLSGRAGSEPRKGRTNPACPMEAALSVYYSEEQSVFSLTQEDSNEKTKRKRPVTVFPNSQVGQGRATSMHHRHRARRRHPWKFGWARRKPQPPWGHEPSERELAAPFHLQSSPAQLLPHADAAGGWMEGTMNGIGLLSLSCWNLILCFNLIGEKKPLSECAGPGFSEQMWGWQ
ncbi:uncharacterized protein LOC120614244 isoform X6 [Pteropus medius]|uniref:uncharacterized protein LOC120614244 isoform X6 n=1 Tax=Pteropus vampyrus TaxID=132908 RepID=UPI00196A7C6C|nr:uncharacterized protein LOC120614244 isoform X6 [Pteropus giganteus]